VIGVQLDRGAEIGKRFRPVALPVPELAAGVEDIGKSGIELQRTVVVGDRALDRILAR
jgi:hypothetical protein